MIDFTKWSVEDMRAELVKLTGMHIDQANMIKGKAVIAERIYDARARLGLDGPEANFNEAEIENTPMIAEENEYSTDSHETRVAAPSYGSPAWEDYVLSHLTESEVVVRGDKKFPKAFGLRRVAQLLCGPIVKSGPVREHVGKDTATVVYEATILWTQGIPYAEYMSEKQTDMFQYRTFSEIADCSPDNTPAPYNLHAAATACTKAQGRLFKNVLQINCHTAEEMSLSVAEEADAIEFNLPNNMDKISTVQKITIEKLSQRLNVDVSKLLASMSLPEDLSTISRAEAQNVMIALNKYQTVTEASENIPSSIKISGE